jgi:hypothetical protein
MSKETVDETEEKDMCMHCGGKKISIEYMYSPYCSSECRYLAKCFDDAMSKDD